MLRTLQGVYSFFIYDSNRRSVFAARDPSGREPLYYAMDEDEALRWPCGLTIRLSRAAAERKGFSLDVPGTLILGLSLQLYQQAIQCAGRGAL